MSPRKLLMALVACAAALLAPVAHAACTSPAGSAGHVIFNTTHKVMQYCNGTNWVNTGLAVPTATQSGCSSPSGQPGEVIYAANLGVIQFCNGENWVNTACADTRNPGGSGCTTPTGNPGDMQYVTAANELQFCDSTNWVAMGWPCAGASTPVDCSTMGGTNLDAYTCRFDAEGIYDLELAANRSMFVQAWGGGSGAGSYDNSYPDSDGAGGGYSEGDVPPTSSARQYKLVVGSGGGAGYTNTTMCPGTSGAYGGGGTGNRNNGSGNGGGYSGIFLSSITHANAVLLAGGAGGGASNSASLKGGVGGGLTGGNGQDNSSKGGTQSAAGTGTPAGAALQGGMANDYVGGGGGYYGGGGAAWGTGGAGGGSAFLAPSLQNASTLSGSGRTSGGSTKPNYYGDAGQGGLGTNTHGQPTSCGKPGMVVVRFSGGSMAIPPLTTMSSISATYGHNCAGVSTGNVTPQATTMCGGKVSCTIAITTPNFGDPAYQCVKKFAISYTCSPVRVHVTDMEYGDTFNLACNGMYNVSATYGFNCAGVQSGNATRPVMSMCNGKENCSFTPSNGNMGGDPAVGCYKKFAMDYTCPDGNRKNISVDYNVAVAPSCP